MDGGAKSKTHTHTTRTRSKCIFCDSAADHDALSKRILANRIRPAALAQRYSSPKSFWNERKTTTCGEGSSRILARAGRPERGRRSDQRAWRVRPELFRGRQRGGGAAGGAPRRPAPRRRRGRLRSVARARARRRVRRTTMNTGRRGGAARALPRRARPGPRGARIGGARLRPDLLQGGADECVGYFEHRARRARAPLRRRPCRQTPWRRSGAP